MVNMNLAAKGMINWLWKGSGSINENLTGCLQRYIVLGCEGGRNDLFLNANSKVLQIILWKDNFNFHQRTGGICEHPARFSLIGPSVLHHRFLVPLAVMFIAT
jgi:hypothetical protein